MDVDAVLALFDPLVDDGPVVVVSLPMLDHQKCPKLKYDPQAISLLKL